MRIMPRILVNFPVQNICASQKFCNILLRQKSKLVFFFFVSQEVVQVWPLFLVAQSSGAVEYTNCISAEE